MALEWSIRYVRDQAERRVLALCIFCDLRNAHFCRLAPRIAGSRVTAYRRLDRALSRIVPGLTADRMTPD